MMSVSMRRAYEMASQFDRGLQASHPDLGHSVHIIHEDGSVFIYDSSFLR